MSARIWVIEDDASLRWVMRQALEQAGHQVREFADAEALVEEDIRFQADLLIMDVRLPGRDGLDVLQDWVANDGAPPVLMITAYSDLDTAVAAYERGAFEYLPKPFDLEDFLALVEKGLAGRPTGADRSDPSPRSGLIGRSPALQEVFRTIGRLARSEVSTLITGESGTGKELVARALHQHSPRRQGPFVAVNTAAVPRDLLESELFGHERGAFTGAVERRRGRFELAAGGSLFLDEIGDMPLELQTRLLRVLAEQEFYRVGGLQPRRADVRILAATHQDLDRLVAEGRFRDDLLHRLDVIRLRIPPLRERPEDIPELAEAFLERAAAETGLAPRRLSPRALQELQGRRWPGNVRELENFCRRITVMAPSEEVDRGDLPLNSSHVETEDWAEAAVQWAEQHACSPDAGIGREAIDRLEHRLIRWALERSNGHRQKAARLLGWGRNTLTRKIRKLGL